MCAADKALQAIGQGAQHGIAGFMAPPHIVDFLEAVEIDPDHRHAAIIGFGQPGVQAGIEAGAVGQAGQRIVQRHVTQAFV